MKHTNQNEPSDFVFEISDYREILRRELRSRVAVNPQYSQRAFARDLGLAASRLNEILANKQGLSAVTAAEVARRLAFTSEEGAYFIDLVRVAHARNPEERKEARARIMSLRAGQAYEPMDLSVFQTLSHWLPFAILELTKTPEFRPSVTEVAAKLEVTEPQVQEAVARLVQIGLLRVEEKKWTPKSSGTLVSRGVPSLAVKNYHRHIISRATGALFQRPMDQREFSALIFSCDRRRLPEVKERVRAFIKEMDAEFGSESKPSDVACLSTQMFLLT